jgi:hypothetical protein
MARGSNGTPCALAELKKMNALCLYNKSLLQDQLSETQLQIAIFGLCKNLQHESFSGCETRRKSAKDVELRLPKK